MDCYEIDLTPYGGKGMIKMAEPTFRKRRDMMNHQTKYIAEMQRDRRGKPVETEGTTLRKGANRKLEIGDIPMGDIAILELLVYVESAPFEPSVEGFLAYCDTLDAIKRGNADALYGEMDRVAGWIRDGDLSPLPNSPQTETKEAD